MRIFVCLLLCASVCRPQSAESAVAAVFRQMEHAELRALGIADENRANIVVGDASWPKSAIFSVAAGAYK